MEEDDRPVLVTVVGSLAVEGRRIVHVPESVQELVIRDFGGIVGDLDRLRVTRSAGADLLVSRVVARATGVAGHRVDHARHLVEKVLNTPEASARKSSF